MGLDYGRAKKWREGFTEERNSETEDNQVDADDDGGP